MYTARTTFVVGAGASLELGFPTSDLLKSQISEAVNIGFEFGNRQIKGDYQIAEALRGYADHYKGQSDEYNKYLHAGWHIGTAMPQAISIDNFVDSQEDEYVTAVAKLGIASCIIDAEKHCLERYKSRDKGEKIEWILFQENWIHQLFQTLNEGTKKSEIENLFSVTNFIVFNYDRSLEYFLAMAISNYYGVDSAKAFDLVSKATFLHPYGQIGRLPWQKSNLPVQDFGSSEKRNLLDISKSILTFSEQVDEKVDLASIRKAIGESTQIIFLGFAFHPSNMQLLVPKRDQDTSRVIATGYGISDSDTVIIGDELKSVCLVDNQARRESQVVLLSTTR